jgi:hypothetical protein
LALAGNIDNRRGLLTTTARRKHSENQPLPANSAHDEKYTGHNPCESCSRRALRDTMRAALLPLASRFGQRSSYSKFFVSFPFFVVNFTGFY